MKDSNTISTQDLRGHLPRIWPRVDGGREEFLVTYHGRPVFRIVPVEATREPDQTTVITAEGCGANAQAVLDERPGVPPYDAQRVNHPGNAREDG